MRKVYSISLSDEEIINHLEKIPNKSNYIKELVQKDMKKKPFSKEQVACIRKMIDEKLKGHVLLDESDKQKKEAVKALDDLLNNF